MRVQLLMIGKSSDENLISLIEVFEKRIRKYADFKIEVIPNIKNPPNERNVLIQKEGDLLISKIDRKNYNILLDVKGQEMSSERLAENINKWLLLGKSRVTFIIAGAFGASKDVQGIVDKKLSLSKMTFSHQLIRLIFMEQLYRAFTINRNEPYHH